MSKNNSNITIVDPVLRLKPTVGGDPSNPFSDFKIEIGINKIGRASSNNIYLKGDTSVSNYHAQLIFNGTFFLIKDLNSLNKTMVQYRPNEDTIVLKPNLEYPIINGSKITFGSATMTLSYMEVHNSNYSSDTINTEKSFSYTDNRLVPPSPPEPNQPMQNINLGTTSTNNSTTTTTTATTTTHADESTEIKYICNNVNSNNKRKQEEDENVDSFDDNLITVKKHRLIDKEEHEENEKNGEIKSIASKYNIEIEDNEDLEIEGAENLNNNINDDRIEQEDYINNNINNNNNNNNMMDEEEEDDEITSSPQPIKKDTKKEKKENKTVKKEKKEEINNTSQNSSSLTSQLSDISNNSGSNSGSVIKRGKRGASKLNDVYISNIGVDIVNSKRRTSKPERLEEQILQSSYDNNSNNNKDQEKEEIIKSPKKQKQPTPKTKTNTSTANSENSNIRILFSMFSDDVVKNFESICIKLGGSLASNSKECTHLVSDEMKRSKKILECISFGKIIVTSKWLKDSKKSNYFLPESQYLLKDEKAETDWSFNLEKSLAIARNRLGSGSALKPLFNNILFYITKNSIPPKDFLKEIIEINGGNILDDIKDAEIKENQKYIIVVIANADKDKRYLKKWSDNSYKVLKGDFILLSTLSQHLIYEGNEI
ncbi:hypothetical protein ACTFIV_007238 [Dictyostelium citrinum]